MRPSPAHTTLQLSGQVQSPKDEPGSRCGQGPPDDPRGQDQGRREAGAGVTKGAIGNPSQGEDVPVLASQVLRVP